MKRVCTRAAKCAATTAVIALTAGCGAARSAPAGMPAPAAAPVGRWLVQSEGAMTPIRQAAVDAARDLGRSIAARLRLPRDITVRLDRCEDRQTGWLRESSEVRLCDETVRGVADALGGTMDTGDDAGNASDVLRSVTRFLLAQQLGRAMTDLLGLGGDASARQQADEFAALFLLGDPALSQDVGSAARVLPLIRHVPGEPLLSPAMQAARTDALLCLAQGASADGSDLCREQLKARLAWWETRLGTVRLH